MPSSLAPFPSQGTRARGGRNQGDLGKSGAQPQGGASWVAPVVENLPAVQETETQV